MSGFVWLASYPKSGNTWLRMFFANLQEGVEAPASINAISSGLASHSRSLFDRLVGYAASDLTFDEVDSIRPDVFRYWAARAGTRLLCKVHEACTRLPDGRWLFPSEATAAVIYVIRNPLDVCVSYMHHSGKNDPGQIADEMADPDNDIGGWPGLLSTQLRQRLLTWSGHVLSWVDAPHLPVHVMRYEDMHAAPVETFAQAAAFMGMPLDRTRIARAVAFSSIEELQRQEQQDGFREGAAPERPFFRKGKVGSWRESLTGSQAARIINDHADVMRRFGYLTAAGDPVY